MNANRIRTDTTESGKPMKTSKYKRPRISDLRQEIAELRRVGGQMANLCFNLGAQSGLPFHQREANREIMLNLVTQWDAIKRRFPKKRASGNASLVKE
jgi:hypothetical protein